MRRICLRLLLRVNLKTLKNSMNSESKIREEISWLNSHQDEEPDVYDSRQKTIESKVMPLLQGVS